MSRPTAERIEEIRRRFADSLAFTHTHDSAVPELLAEIDALRQERDAAERAYAASEHATGQFAARVRELEGALAAMLQEFNQSVVFPYGIGYKRAAAWFRERDVVVLPPAVAEVLRTGEPSAAMVDEAGIESQKWVALDQPSLDDKMRKVLRRALAVLRDSIGASPQRSAPCAADRDGDCSAEDCPQLADNEPATSGRHCPRDCGPSEEV